MRLQDWQIRTLRRAAADGARVTDLAAYYGISPQHISRLTRGMHRTEAGGPITPDTPNRPRLTDEVVRAIRDAVAAGQRPGEVAKAFDLHKATVTDIIHGVRYPHAPGPITAKDHRRDLGGRPLALSVEQRQEVADLLRRGETVTDLAEKFGVSRPLITKIRKEHRIAPRRGQGRCGKGHLLDLDNAYVDTVGRHRCKACRNRRQREYRRVNIPNPNQLMGAS